MATRGRKPTPTAIKELEGNPGKRALNAKEPKPEKKAPLCPKWLEAEANSGWAKCVFNGITGYVKDDYVSKTSPRETADPLIRITSSGGKVNIRRGNGTEYSPVTSVIPDTSLPYVATALNGWYAVKTGKQVGWVSPDYAVLLGKD